MAALKRGYETLKAYLQNIPDSPIVSLGLDGETISFRLERPERASQISLVYTDASAYPSSGVFICDAVENDALSSIAEDFQDKAPLPTVLRKVCLAYEVPTSFLDGLDRTAEPTNNDDESASEGSTMQDDNSEYSDQGSGGSGEGSDMETDMHGADEDDGDGLDIEVRRREGRWKRHEEALEAAAAEAAASTSSTASRPGGSGANKPRDLAQKLQMFSAAEIFQMLARELMNLFRMQSAEMYADSIGDDVYRWRVEIFGFQPDSPLGKDLSELSRRYACSSVVLHLTFQREGYPFYPAAVEVVRPHLCAPTINVVASHPRLRLKNWDPFLPQHQLLMEIKEFLQAHARVDLPHPRNDLSRYPDSAYSPLEVQLARLEAITEVPPLCTERYHDIYTARDSFVRNDNCLETLAQSPKRSRKEQEGVAAKKGRSGWAAGTGYGHGGEKSEVWDAVAAEAAQRALDREMEQLMTGVAQSLRTEMGTVPAAAVPEGPEAAPGAPEPSDQHQESPAASCMSVDGHATAPGEPSNLAGAVETVCDSCLAPFLAQELAKASFTDMTARAPYYTTLLQVTLQLCRPELLSLLTSAPSGRSLADAVMHLQPAATHFLRAVEQHAERPPPPQATTSANLPVSASAIREAQQERDALQLSRLLLHLCTALERCGARQAMEATSRAAPPVEPLRDYCTQMRPFQLEHLSEFSSPHAFLKNSQAEGVHPRERVLRLAREAAGLSDLLPLNESSSILVRVLDSNISLWQALITGPEDTPYAGGCFFFDFYFPTQYPKVAPQVQFKTTGGGTIRFNPNLYNCGKVCLSLLGTWQGNRGEQWNPDVSSTLQVLISIQSLILVPDPYFNEPGFERDIGTDRGTAASRDYNKVIQIGTLGRAMVDYLQRPPPEFADAVRAHFRLRGDWILANAQRWIDDAMTYDTGHAAALRRLRSQLVPLIEALN